MKLEEYTELENHLLQASKSLKCAWRIMKFNGNELSAKELADTVLDVEESHRLTKNKIDTFKTYCKR